MWSVSSTGSLGSQERYCRRTVASWALPVVRFQSTTKVRGTHRSELADHHDGRQANHPACAVRGGAGAAPLAGGTSGGGVPGPHRGARQDGGRVEDPAGAV